MILRLFRRRRVTRGMRGNVISYSRRSLENLYSSHEREGGEARRDLLFVFGGSRNQAARRARCEPRQDSAFRKSGREISAPCFFLPPSKS